MSKSCRKASELMSMRMEQGLTLSLRISLGFHLAICAGCRRAQRQFLFLRKASRHLGGLE